MKLFPILGIVLALSLPSFAEEEAAPAGEFGSSLIDEALSSDQAPVEAAESAEPAVAETPAAETPAPVEEPAAAPKFVVFMPEQIDAEWFWYYYSDMAQHIVQSAVEKELIKAGFEVIDMASIKMLQDAGSLERISSVEFATQAAKSAGADYAVVGKATAVRASTGEAYGVTVVRSQAEITAKLIRVSDGKVIDVVDASALVGGQAQRAAGQEAIKKASADVAKKIVRAVKQASAAK
jgi:hypothetical protein